MVRTRFITSAAEPQQFPRSARPELAFIGRSNVGKSSLLNALAGSEVARTSRTPGRTQLVNFFEVGERYTFADLPGLGYAKVPKAVRARWRALVEAYLEQREPLALVLWLHDLRREAEADDVAFFRERASALEARGARLLLVATKADKHGKAQVKPALAALARAYGVSPDEAIATSAVTRAGLRELWGRMEAIRKGAAERA